jgi:hypothetical protein
MELQSQELDSGILGISFVRPNGQCRYSQIDMRFTALTVTRKAPVPS